MMVQGTAKQFTWVVRNPKIVVGLEERKEYIPGVKGGARSRPSSAPVSRLKRTMKGAIEMPTGYGNDQGGGLHLDT